MGKREKFLEGIKFPCFIESAKFYIDKESYRKVRVDIVLTLEDKTLAFLPTNMQAVAKTMKADKVERAVFGHELEERMVELYGDADPDEPKPAVTVEDVAIKKVRLECDEDTGQVTLHFSFVGDDKAIGTWIHENYGRDAFVNVLAMQGELAGL